MVRRVGNRFYAGTSRTYETRFLTFNVWSSDLAIVVPAIHSSSEPYNA